MKGWMVTTAAVAALGWAGAASAQTTPYNPQAGGQAAIQSSVQTGQSAQTRPAPVRPVQPLSERNRTTYASASEEPDVLLDVPNLSVEEIQLEVDNLEVHVALDARLANLLKLTAGADASIDRVNLTIKGVQASALLKVRLDNVAAIIDRTLTTIDRNPQLLERLLDSLDNTVDTVGGVADTALQPGGVVSQTVNQLGQTVQTTVSTTGQVVERTLDQTGQVVNERTLGTVLDTARTGFRVIGERTDPQGRTVRRLQDRAGNIVEATVDSSGRIVSTRTVSGAR